MPIRVTVETFDHATIQRIIDQYNSTKTAEMPAIELLKRHEFGFGIVGTNRNLRFWKKILYHTWPNVSLTDDEEQHLFVSMRAVIGEQAVFETGEPNIDGKFPVPK